MAHFFGSVKGRSNEVTRLGNKNTGLHTVAASWEGAVSVWMHENDGKDYVTVSLIPWHGRGTTRVLYSGPVDGSEQS